MKKWDSNNPQTPLRNVCRQCGLAANTLTCLKRYGQLPKKPCFDCSTIHLGICDFCKLEKMVTETRDFFYPDFSGLKRGWLK